MSLTIVDRDTGDWLPAHPHRGQHWIAGTPGHRYAVRLANTTGRRVLVVLSIDGINAVTGETAAPSQAGYVLEPWQSTEIAGWRKSMGAIAGFVFTDHHDSYASRTGRPANVGVIGIAVFEEREYPRYPTSPPAVSGTMSPRREDSRAIGAEAAEARSDEYFASAAEAAPQRLGTGHGAGEWSPASRTHFARASRHPAQVAELRYDAFDRLVARGVLPPHRGYRAEPPRAFPTGFVPDPPAY